MKRIIYFISVALIFQSCLKEIPIKLNGKTDPLPVFHLFLQPDSLVHASFSHACGITDPIPQEDAATVLVYKNNSLLGAMTAKGNGNYLLSSGLFAPRDSFKIKANDGLNFFEVRGRLPSSILILPVSIIPSEDTSTKLIPGVGPAFSLRITLPDSAVDDNYYRIYLKRKYYSYTLNNSGQRVDSLFHDEIIEIHGSELPFIQNNFNNYTSHEILFSDITFNGTNVPLEIYTPTKLTNTNSSRTLSLTIFLENIDKCLFDFYNTRNAHLWQQQSITQLPGFIEGNIPGGYGVAGAFTFSYKVINWK